MLDSVTWGVFAVTFTILGAAATWLAFRRRGPRAGARWLAVTLLVPAAYLTHTLRMLGRVGSAVADWATSFVWNPLVWVGLGLAAVSVVLLAVAPRLPGRSGAAPGAGRPLAPGGSGAAGRGGSPDSELDEIEALLKRRGIS